MSMEHLEITRDTHQDQLKRIGNVSNSLSYQAQVVGIYITISYDSNNCRAWPLPINTKIITVNCDNDTQGRAGAVWPWCLQQLRSKLCHLFRWYFSPIYLYSCLWSQGYCLIWHLITYQEQHQGSSKFIF